MVVACVMLLARIMLLVYVIVLACVKELTLVMLTLWCESILFYCVMCYGVILYYCVQSLTYGVILCYCYVVNKCSNRCSAVFSLEMLLTHVMILVRAICLYPMI